MNEEQANDVRSGDTVLVGGYPYKVKSIKAKGIAAPQFRLSPIGHGMIEPGLTSYRLCTIPKTTPEFRIYANDPNYAGSPLTPDAVGDDNWFDSEDEAWACIETLKTYGDDWANREYEVREESR